MLWSSLGGLWAQVAANRDRERMLGDLGGKDNVLIFLVSRAVLCSRRHIVDLGAPCHAHHDRIRREHSVSLLQRAALLHGSFLAS